MKKWTESAIRKAAKSCSTRTEFIKKYSRAYNLSLQMGIKDSVLAHLPRVRGADRSDDSFKKVFKWTDAELLKIAGRFKTWKELKEYDPAVCRAIKRRNLQTNLENASRKWYSDEEIIKRAKPFSSRYAFEKGDKRAYEVAKHRGILDVCFASHPSLGYVVTDENFFIYVIRVTHKYGRQLKRPQVYIGLSRDPNHRLQQHKLNPRHVGVDLSKCRFTFRKYGPMSASEAMMQEKIKIARYRANVKCAVLNSSSGGSLGYLPEQRKQRVALNKKLLKGRS